MTNLVALVIVVLVFILLAIALICVIGYFTFKELDEIKKDIKSILDKIK